MGYCSLSIIMLMALPGMVRTACVIIVVRVEMARREEDAVIMRRQHVFNCNQREGWREGGQKSRIIT